MLGGLSLVREDLADLNIPFIILNGEPPQKLLQFVEKFSVSALISDFSPIREGREWRNGVAKKINCSFYEVDTHNIVPAWVTSDKQEYSARTIRSKLVKKLPDYLVPFKVVQRQNREVTEDFLTLIPNEIGFTNKILSVKSYEGLSAVSPERLLQEFIDLKLDSYSRSRNNPLVDGTSNLSAALHFGHISSQGVILKIIEEFGKTNKYDVQKYLENPKGNFFDEIIVRKELADNFCLYNKNYDNYLGFPNWAQKSLNAHRGDKRDTVYTIRQLEQAETHDDLWNAAQVQMVSTGKMHGYLRMYWAKKILEWSSSPEEAIISSIYLNDKYELDGRDPNGYAGIAWSIGGLHDRPWFDRPIFGQVRYMSYSGMKRKFDVESFVKLYV